MDTFEMKRAKRIKTLSRIGCIKTLVHLMWNIEKLYVKLKCVWLFLSEELCTSELKLQALRFFHNVFVFTLVSCFKRNDVLNRSKIPRNNKYLQC